MAVDIVVPSPGESITSGIIAQWLKADGDTIRETEPVFELETDKAALEVPAPASGVLSIRVQEGETVDVGDVVGSIEEKDVPAEDNTEQEVAPAKQSDNGAEALLTPAARQIVADEELDPAKIEGTGREGRVLKEDVLKYLEERPTKSESTKDEPAPEKSEPAPKESPKGRETRKAMSPLRQRIAERLVQAQNQAALLTTFNEVDMSAVLALRSEYKEAFKKKHDINLGFMGFFVKASCGAMRAFPEVNARIDGADIVTYHYCNVGVAVSTDKGLLVPVLRDADQMSFADIEKTIGILADKARKGKIALPELQGGTFTITNGGVFGSLLSTPIVNPPQSAILGMHAIQKRAVVIDDEVVVRPMMYVALSYDHRLIDGKEAVQFLVRIKECIEHPARMLLDV